MLRTKEEMAKTWCPMARVSTAQGSFKPEGSGEDNRCVVEGCAMIRVYDTGVHGVRSYYYCGLAGKP